MPSGVVNLNLKMAFNLGNHLDDVVIHLETFQTNSKLGCDTKMMKLIFLCGPYIGYKGNSKSKILVGF